MKGKINQALFTVVFLSFAVTGCKNKETAENTETQPIAVKVMTVKESPMLSSSNYSGTIEESSGTSLSFSTPGTVKSVHVKVGQHVSKGTLVATLDDTNARSSYDMAKSTLIQAEDAFSRMKQLHDNNSLPEIEWVDAQTKLQQAKSALDIATKNLNDCRLISPVSGVISKKDIEAGQNVMPGAAVAKVSAINTVKVNISVPENEIAGIGYNQEVNLTVPALGNCSFTGNVIEKGIEANQLSRTYTVKASIPNPDSELMPGMICKVALPSTATDNHIIVPSNVVQIGSGSEKFVWVNDNGKAAKRNIHIGGQTSAGIIVETGLNGGECLIVEGQQKVSEGTPVTVIK